MGMRKISRVERLLPAQFPTYVWTAIANGLSGQARLSTEFAQWRYARSHCQQSVLAFGSVPVAVRWPLELIVKVWHAESFAWLVPAIGAAVMVYVAGVPTDAELAGATAALATMLVML